MTGLECRPKAVKACPHEGCDWFLVTEWFVGSPDRVKKVPQDAQEASAGEHMKVHYPKPKEYFT